MEPNSENHTESIEKTEDVAIEIIKDIETTWPEHITILSLDHRNITSLNENVKFPPNLEDLDLSYNNFVEIPSAVLTLVNLRSLNISYNKIRYFDDTPGFSHCIERLNVANNDLHGPPYWIWSETPALLVQLDLSGNIHIKTELDNKYDQFLRHTTLVTDIKLYNCSLRNHSELLQTFSKAKVLDFGNPNLSFSVSNRIDCVPCKGLDKCFDIEILNLSNTQIYSIESNIDIFENLLEINLSQNNLIGLPDKFCSLENLEVCILSCNNISYLPEDMALLKKLVCLRLDSNRLCMLPENMGKLSCLKLLDLYDNCLYEVSDELNNISELDFAQNYMNEPEDTEYLKKKEKLRVNIDNRYDGRKEEEIVPEILSSDKSDISDDEELINYLNNASKEPVPETTDPPSSPEDWDSDDYWVPCYYHSQTTQPSLWDRFVQQKLQEGHFCPADIHPISVADQIEYERLSNPKVWHVVPGQFDCSDDESDN